MKRKILILLTMVIATFVCVFTVGCQGGCNKEIFDLQYAYNRAYVQIGDEWVDIPIYAWTDYEGE